jgi:hypothetical protein
MPFTIFKENKIEASALASVRQALSTYQHTAKHMSCGDTTAQALPEQSHKSSRNALNTHAALITLQQGVTCAKAQGSACPGDFHKDLSTNRITLEPFTAAYRGQRSSLHTPRAGSGRWPPEYVRGDC